MSADNRYKKNGLAGRLLTMNKDVRPDCVTSTYAERNSPIHLSLSLLQASDGEEGKPVILVEGDSETLLFLADLLLAQAQDSTDCGCQIGPDGPGGVFFDPRSTYGIYIHCFPCQNSKD